MISQQQYTNNDSYKQWSEFTNGWSNELLFPIIDTITYGTQTTNVIIILKLNK